MKRKEILLQSNTETKKFKSDSLTDLLMAAESLESKKYYSLEKLILTVCANTIRCRSFQTEEKSTIMDAAIQ